ncbi:MAG: hypothetical protein IT379_38275 [Deltaproteobacteria bacterium]|nr:hypothetical protein [Deltaproteobacteria bacterium]
MKPLLLVSWVALAAGCCCPLGSLQPSSSSSSSTPVVTPTFPPPAVPTAPVPPPEPPPVPPPVAPPSGSGASGATRPPPASFGIQACDDYAAAACSCANAMVRDSLCDGAHTSFNSWRNAVRFASTRSTIETACRNMIGTITNACSR